MGGVTVDSAAQTFAAGTGQVIAWWYSLGGQACLSVNGTATCGGTVAAVTPGPFLTLGAFANPTTVVGDMSIGWAAVLGDKGLSGSIRNLVLGPTPAPGTVRQGVACLGDSLTFGYSSTTPYPYVLQGLLGSTHSVDNHGVYGQVLHGNTLNGSIHARYWRDIEPFGYSTVVVMAGTNDVTGGQTAVQIEAWLQSIYDSVRAAGKRLVPITIPPNGAWSAGQKTVRNDVNTWILGYCTTNGITCADVGADFDDGSGALKTIYNSGDGLHFNQTGYDRVAALVRAAFP